MGRNLDDLARRYGLSHQPILLIVDAQGRIVQQFPSYLPEEAVLLAPELPQRIEDEPQILRLEPLHDRVPLLAAAHPVASAGGEKYGYALYVAPEINVITLMQKFQVIRLGWLATMLLCGWAIIYVFTRRLIKPIRETAEAAKQVAAGNYQINLSKSYQKKNYELLSSFKEMADRLRLLESLRTQLLAGVTHELKTPVTSISGLIQAVRDEVVSGDEARTFLDASLKECARLQRMMEDLLDFNRFAGGSVQVVYEPIDLHASVREMVERWRRAQEQDRIDVTITVPEETEIEQMLTDPARLEQIIVNLLNNAAAAIHEDGAISLRIAAEDDSVNIHIQDTGEGIPEEERANVFEPFFRGKKKTSQVRGLGLGLPFSRLIARSLGGDLLLTESGAGGSTFTIVLPLAVSTRRTTP